MAIKSYNHGTGKFQIQFDSLVEKYIDAERSVTRELLEACTNLLFEFYHNKMQDKYNVNKSIGILNFHLGIGISKFNEYSLNETIDKVILGIGNSVKQIYN